MQHMDRLTSRSRDRTIVTRAANAYSADQWVKFFLPRTSLAPLAMLACPRQLAYTACAAARTVDVPQSAEPQRLF